MLRTKATTTNLGLLDQRYLKLSGSLAEVSTHSHTVLTDIGTNTHAQIDTFIGTTVPATYLKLDGSNDPMTGALSFNVNSATALLVEQDGVKDNVLVVDTTNSLVGINSLGVSGYQLYIQTGATTTRGLGIKATASQSVNLLNVLNSSGGVIAAINAYGGLIASPNITDPAGVAYFGVNGTLTIDNSTAASTGINRGVNFNVYVNGGYNATGEVRGGDMAAYTHADYTGTVTSVVGMVMGVGNLGAGIITTATALKTTIFNPGAGTITTYFGLDINAWDSTKVTGAAVGVRINTASAITGTTKYGLYIGSVTNAPTANYAIYTNLGDIRFGDDVLIASPNATALIIGAGTAGIDYQIKVDGQTNDGILTWMEDEDYFQFEDDLNLNTGEVLKVGGTQVVGARVVDARCDDVINSGDATTDGVIDALRDAMIAHGLIAAA